MLLYLPPCTRGQAEGAPPAAPPGLSHAAAKRVCGKLGPEEVRGELLAAKKLSVLRLLGCAVGTSPLFAPAEVLPHWIVASCDADGKVALHGDIELKRLQKEEVERGETLDALTSLVLGAAAAGDERIAAARPTGDERSAANTGVRVKAAQTLGRSVAAAARFPGTLQAAFHCLFGADATPRLMQAGAELARHLAVHCPAAQLATIGPPLLSGLVKVLRHESLPNGLRPEQPEAVSMRAYSYGS